MGKHSIVFIHSLNNFTGSPNVLATIVRGFIAKGYKAEVITNRSRGFLSDIDGVDYDYTCYRWSSNRVKTLLLLLLSQLQVFFKLLFYPSTNAVYYINSIVPFGAVLACWMTRKKYVIHVHENMRQRKPIYIIFRTSYRIFNKKSIFVSEYLRATALNCRDGVVIYNALPLEFESKTSKSSGDSVLMVSSLRRFKGIYEFVKLSAMMPQYKFELVLSASRSEVDEFVAEIGMLENLKVYPSQTDLHPFYKRAKLLLQLSHPESCVETFGLTILEAMVYGVPAIVPNVGGPTELVSDGVNGYTVNHHDVEDVRSKIEKLMTDTDLYSSFSQAALSKFKMFGEKKMIDSIENYIFPSFKK